MADSASAATQAAKPSTRGGRRIDAKTVAGPAGATGRAGYTGLAKKDGMSCGMAAAARGVIRAMVRTANPARSRDSRLASLDAPSSAVAGGHRTAIAWLRRAIRTERALALKGAAQYSFTQHVALLRALEAELAGARNGKQAPDSGDALATTDDAAPSNEA